METEDAAPSNEGIGGKLTRCLCIIYSKAITCNGQKNIGELRNKKRNSVVEALHLACNRAVHDHQWVSEISLLMHEHDVLQKFHYDIDVPCVAQWAASPRLHVDLIIEGRGSSPGVGFHNTDVKDVSFGRVLLRPISTWAKFYLGQFVSGARRVGDPEKVGGGEGWGPEGWGPKAPEAARVSQSDPREAQTHTLRGPWP